MGFFDWLLGRKEKKEVEAKPLPKEDVDVGRVITGIEARGENIEEEYRSVKIVDLRSDLDINGIRDELIRNNVIIVDTKDIFANRVLADDLTEKLKNTVESVHGDLARITNERFLTVPAGMKIMSR